MYAPDPAAGGLLGERGVDAVEVPRLAPRPGQDARLEAKALGLPGQAFAEFAVDEHDAALADEAELALLCGEPGFDGEYRGPWLGRIDPRNVSIIGARSVDRDERRLLNARGVEVLDMRRIDEAGVVALMRGVIERVKQAGGHLHVSLDVDAMDPAIAPGGGTLVPGRNITDAYASALSDIGVRVQSARSSVSVSSSRAQTAEAARANKAGVNLDEEAARLIQFQQSYQAAAKMLQVATSVFDTLLEMTGG